MAYRVTEKKQKKTKTNARREYFCPENVGIGKVTAYDAPTLETPSVNGKS